MQPKQLALDARFALHPECFVANPPTAELPLARVVIKPVTPGQIDAGATDPVNLPTLPSRLQGEEDLPLVARRKMKSDRRTSASSFFDTLRPKRGA